MVVLLAEFEFGSIKIEIVGKWKLVWHKAFNVEIHMFMYHFDFDLENNRLTFKGLVLLLNGISTFMGYLNAKANLVYKVVVPEMRGISLFIPFSRLFARKRTK